MKIFTKDKRISHFVCGGVNVANTGSNDPILDIFEFWTLQRQQAIYDFYAY